MLPFTCPVCEQIQTPKGEKDKIAIPLGETYICHTCSSSAFEKLEVSHNDIKNICRDEAMTFLLIRLISKLQL